MVSYHPKLAQLATFVLLSIAFEANAEVVSFDLPIVNVDLSPDGFNRSTVVAGGMFPGPLIAASKGDNLQINVTDLLTNKGMNRSTSIHWHGLFQAGTNEMDGAAFVTQCPIVPNNSFVYNFSVPDQTGTYWYHSHFSSQYCDGLRGPLIIYDPHDPQAYLYDVDDDSTVITLADWYHGFSTDLFPNPNHTSPIANSTLINGLGRYSGGPIEPPLAVIRAQPGKRHRFRLISTSCDPSYTFSIDNHNMTIIEADGVETQPLTVDSLVIFAGQRYSIIVEANQTIGNYWIRANPSSGSTGFVNGINSAILRYDNAPETDPASTQTPSVIPLNEANLSPLVNPGAPGKPAPGPLGADITIDFSISRNSTTGNFALNGVSFLPPSVPVLLQILNGTKNPQDLLPPGSVYNLTGNKVVEVSMRGGRNHPFHLHGHTFDVVRVAGSSTYNYANPVRRDVVNIGGPDDNVTFRFITDNPGPWFLHCHIDWHLEAGLAVVMAENIPDTPAANPNTTAWNELCPNFNENNPDKRWGIGE